MSRRGPNCLICCEETDKLSGIECNSEEKHFLCFKCFGADNLEHQLCPEARGKFIENDRLLVCQWCLPKQKSAFTHRQIVLALKNDENLEAYEKARDEVASKIAQDEVINIFKRKEAEDDRVSTTTTQRQFRVERHRLRICEDILTLACPRCKLAMLDFDGCFAVDCTNCRCSFCAWCMTDCGTAEQGHSHVTQCQRSLNPGNLYGRANKDDFNVVQGERRRLLVLRYLNEHVIEEDRSELLKAIAQDLADLRISTSVTDEVMGAHCHQYGENIMGSACSEGRGSEKRREQRGGSVVTGERLKVSSAVWLCKNCSQLNSESLLQCQACRHFCVGDISEGGYGISDRHHDEMTALECMRYSSRGEERAHHVRRATGGGDSDSMHDFLRGDISGEHSEIMPIERLTRVQDLYFESALERRPQEPSSEHSPWSCLNCTFDNNPLMPK